MSLIILVSACKGFRYCTLIKLLRRWKPHWALISTTKPNKDEKFFADWWHWNIVALRVFTHFTAHLCPVAPCQSFTALSNTPTNDRRMPFECHLTPSAPAMTSSAPWAALTLSHISTAKQECLTLLVCLNWISSLPLSKFSHRPVHHTAPLIPFFSLYSKLEKEKKKEREKCLSTSRKHRDEWLFRVRLLGKGGCSVCEMQSGRECVDFGQMHMRGAWCKGTLQTYIRTEGLNSLLSLSKSSGGGSTTPSVRLNSHQRDSYANFWLVEHLEQM